MSSSMRALLAGGLFPITLLCSEGATAQNFPVTLDTVRSVATRLTPSFLHNTRSVEILDRERLMALPVGTVAEALGWALGADLQARSHAQADLAIRGSSHEHVLVLVDGVPMSDPQTGHFDLDLTMPLARVERIEILRGAASALYGADAMGGVVNIVTREPLTHVEARVEGGSYETLASSLDGGLALGKTRFAAGAGYSRSDGHRLGTDHRIGELHLQAISELLGGSLRGSAGQSWKDFGAADFYAPYPSYEETRTSTVGAAWKGPLTDRIDLEPRLNWRRHKDYFVLDREDPAFYSNQHVSSQVGAEAVIRIRADEGLSVAAGGQVGRDFLESTNLGDRDEDRGALFAEAMSVTGPLTVSAGFRGDHHESFGFFGSPSLSAAYRWHTLKLRASVARSFRAPTWTERYYEDPVNLGNPDLEPERAWTVEVGGDLDLTSGLWISTTAYRRSATNLIDWSRPTDDPEARWETRNVKSAVFRGLEIELTGVLRLGTRVGVQGSLLSVSAADADGYVSKYSLRPLTRDISFSVGHGFGPAETDTRLSFRQREGESGYWLLDLRLALPVGRSEFFFDLLNGIDSEYVDIGGAPAAGRSVRVGVAVGG